MLEKISSILNSKFGKKDNLSKQIQIVKVFDLYRDGVKALFPNDPPAEPISLKDKNLLIQTESSSHASELRLREHEIVEIINNHFQKEVVNRVSYKF